MPIRLTQFGGLEQTQLRPGEIVALSDVAAGMTDAADWLSRWRAA